MVETRGAKTVCRRGALSARVVTAKIETERLSTKPVMCRAWIAESKHPVWRMQFDHRNGDEKVACVSELISMGTLNKLLAEIAKCDVVCANCHCDRTHRRKNE